MSLKRREHSRLSIILYYGTEQLPRAIILLLLLVKNYKANTVSNVIQICDFILLENIRTNMTSSNLKTAAEQILTLLFYILFVKKIIRNYKFQFKKIQLVIVCLLSSFIIWNMNPDSYFWSLSTFRLHDNITSSLCSSTTLHKIKQQVHYQLQCHCIFIMYSCSVHYGK